jgi:exo-beta-1,3-glucanase (GH17 family)
MERAMASSHDVMAGRGDCDAAARRRWPAALAIALLVALANLLAWRLAHPPLPAPDAPPRVGGLAYNAFQRYQSPLDRDYPSDAQIDADLRLLATITKRLRTYSAAEFPQLPALAERHGLGLALGVWLDRRFDNNDAEIEAAIRAARRHASVQRLIVGNETQLHRTLAPAELHAALQRVRRATQVPVSTAEPWHVWVYQPELARHVDFITVHLLPYWEGVSVAQAVDDALLRLRLVRERHPGKPLVIGEIGWPSGGDAVRSALATPDAQAAFVREFLVRTQTMGLDYYLMEAVDQPWKRATEGAVGAHWGLLDASRRLKFSFSGPVQTDPY